MRNCKRRKTNLEMAWIDYKKAYDILPYSWILDTLQLIGVAQNIQRLVGGSMKNWRTTLMSNGQNLGDVNIRRCIFQGDRLSPLLFVVCLIPLSVILRKTKGKYQLRKEDESINHLLFMDDLKLYGSDERQIDSLINTVRVFNDDIRMEFGLKKCGLVVMKRSKVVKYDGVDLADGRRMNSFEEDPGCRDEDQVAKRVLPQTEENSEVQIEWKECDYGSEHLGCVTLTIWERCNQLD